MHFHFFSIIQLFNYDCIKLTMRCYYYSLLYIQFYIHICLKNKEISIVFHLFPLLCYRIDFKKIKTI